MSEVPKSVVLGHAKGEDLPRCGWIIEASGSSENVLVKPLSGRVISPFETVVYQAGSHETAEQPLSQKTLRGLAAAVSLQSKAYPILKRDSNPSEHVTVGRARRNDVVLQDPDISGVHAYFGLTAYAFLLSDANSKNGTFLNKRRLESNFEPLQSGDCVRLAGRVFYFCTHEALLALLHSGLLD